VLAYCAAKLCGIANMEETTKVKMEEYRKGLSVFDLQLTAEEVSSKLPQSNDWFSEQIHKWIKDELVADVTLFTEGQILGVIGRSAIFDRACVKSIGELYSELLAGRAHPVVNGESTSQEKESTSGSSEISTVTKGLDHVEELQPEPAVVPPVELAIRGNGEVAKSNGIVKDSSKINTIEPSPVLNGEHQPARNGEHQPARNEEPQPTHNGEPQPTRNGETQSIRNGEPQPTRNGEPQSTRNGESQSTRNGESQSTRNSQDSNTHPKEDAKIRNGPTVEVSTKENAKENAKENSKTSLGGSLEEHIKAVVPENEEKDEEPTPTTETLSKATDSAGETPKSKIPTGKKTKKGKKKGS